MPGNLGAQDLSEAALGGHIRIHDGNFVDSHGRTLTLRGLNVSGASKLPTTPNGLSHLTDGFYEHRTVTFTGRPFPIDEAPLHFRRLQAWGLPLIRLLVTWESIGHSGPDPATDLDLEYIAYLRQLIELMPQYGIKCFICAHQDVWSRFSGGSGAPGWTFGAAGFDIEAFTDTGAAYVHGPDEERRARLPVNDKEPSGPFVWPSGYQKLAASTMATLFWAGDALAPELKCPRVRDGVFERVSIQTYLQDAMIGAFGRLADEVGGLEACIGFEPINEPHRGLINLHGFHQWNYETDLHIGHYPSFAQALALGSGYAQTVDFYVKSWPFPTRVSHRSLVDPQGRSAWLSHSREVSVSEQHGMGQCVWRAHGVWDWDDKKKTPVILKPDYFDCDHRPGREGKQIEWYRDFYGPFIEKFTDRVSRSEGNNFTFIEPIPNEFMPPWKTEDGETNDSPLEQKYSAPTYIDSKRPHNMVYAPHFYDLNVLFSKHHSWMSVNVQGLSRGMFILKALYFGVRGLHKNYKKQIGNIIDYGHKSLGTNVPTIIGEVGISYDINGNFAFLTGCYDAQRQLMNALIDAMESNFTGFTLWNYNPHNRVEYGDGWNKEDFSVINGDEIDEQGPILPDYRNREHEDDELYRGGRVLDVIIRPYAVKTAGKPLKSVWDYRTLRYDFAWRSESNGKAATGGKARTTEIFIPKYHYSNYELRVTLSDGEWSFDADAQTLLVQHNVHEGTAQHTITVEIADVDKHLLSKVMQRRQTQAARTFLDNLPPAVTVTLEGFDHTFVLGALLAVVLAIFISVILNRNTTW
ncbi:Cellulase (glycosyl hydrolase family 5) [Geosmithia morbida]|uniref:Cellulase (Glycosyl hydrolase family 5) n=1 Tax=Geosmithia morbida TaxID=1094350 RepID=A0A9P4YSL4_9HYPO|nr:Cellulase (glycosyl hydrolase family 5) [Geosmithia morbida]KAF4122361.1 Cellulase (glycosyl hydrolase family 5) [Geosmithia morbida]